MTLHTQFVTLGMMFAGGLALGVLFDLYRVLSGQLKLPSWLKAVCDLLYWFIGTLVVFKLLYESNRGEVRPFIFLGLGMGIIVYFLLFSRPVVRVIVFMIRVVLTTLWIGKRMIEIFIITPIIWTYRLLMIFLGFLTATAIFLYKIVLQLLYPVWKLLKWLIRPLIARLRLAVPAWVKRTGQSIAAWFRRLF
ncbi:spore cortex biosynthesis protein YabQ [Paenibacillus filicis]|uniref:Spore cortex biosynthesis protein YabQ n=1 Tax=Paenibacillus gyeongsangnamensis TaxID=3388067 RepID=A0ABT4QL39_9BACL|nr:spore cortex biosynthesis protein YabQ [Paenibacillus filicis]MCZ8517578.1 spore cortex biosynthesis protein YabQ [Paenibacillus filicis]